MDKEILNKCPHPVTLVGENGAMVLDPVRPPVRIATTPGPIVDEVNGIEIQGPSIYESIEGLPEYNPNRVIVVSQLVALAVSVMNPERDDIVYPESGSAAFRNQDGVIATRRLVRAT